MDVIVHAGENRKARRLAQWRWNDGNGRPRQSKRQRAIAALPTSYVLPDPYQAAKHRRPDHEKPSPVATSTARHRADYRCEECQKDVRPLGAPQCEPRFHDVSSRRLIDTAETEAWPPPPLNKCADGAQKSSKRFNADNPRDTFAYRKPPPGMKDILANMARRNYRTQTNQGI